MSPLYFFILFALMNLRDKGKRLRDRSRISLLGELLFMLAIFILFVLLFVYPLLRFLLEWARG